ncbi:MAG: AraC family transcriptional regulator [Sedimentibacter sp.]|uniref:helix-turn-helix transcriptional regulator n=1 Tax=Sedimentibacter sp. TaxID=1960295 RepID=UPI00315820D6
MDCIDQEFRDNDEFVRMILLNEIVIGQKEEYVRNELISHGSAELNVRFSDYYILLTGLKKEVYYGAYHIEAGDYMKIFNSARDSISEYLTEKGFDYEIFLYLYFNTKQMCIFFNRNNNSDSEVEGCTEYINNVLQNMYEQIIFKGEKRYYNFTVVSNILNDYSEISQAFIDLQEIGKLSFFHNKSMVMDHKRLMDIKRNFTYAQANNLMSEIIELISTGQVQQCQEKAKDLFLQNMRHSYDISLCWDILTELKRQVYQFNILYDLNLDDELESKFKLSSYSNIFEMYEALDEIIQTCSHAALKNGNGICYISQHAIRFIKNNYNNEISLNDIASHVKVVPTYLSEIFNKEIGMSIPQYLTRLRIEKSKKLLSETGMKVFEVANSVGIKDANYFGKIFKRHVGVTPQQYHEDNRN